MESKDVRIGMSVRVREDCREVRLRGKVGMVSERYGDAGYAAFEVRLLDGKPELFWHYELEEAAEEAA